MKLWTATILQSVMIQQSTWSGYPQKNPYEANAIETFAKLTPPNSQIDVDHITNGQFIANNHNTNKIFTRQLSSDITKMTHTHNTA